MEITSERPTPLRGLVKGFVILGFAALIWAWPSMGEMAVSYGMLALWLPIVITGLCLWRGVKALVGYKKLYVSTLNVSLWGALLLVFVSQLILFGVWG